MKKFELQANLGTDDARRCNQDFDTKLSLEVKDLKAGSAVELTDAAVNYLTVKRKMIALLAAVGTLAAKEAAEEKARAEAKKEAEEQLRGEAKKVELTGHSKQ